MVVTLPQAQTNGIALKSEMANQQSIEKNGHNGVVQPLGDARNYVLEAVKDEQMLNELVKYQVDYAHSIGAVGLWDERKESNFLAVTVPLSLLPSPFPKELFEEAKAVQQTLSELYYRISLDYDFLVEAYRDVVKADPFIARLMDIMGKVHKEGIRQKISLSVQRADYMSHWNEQKGILELKQVEVNIGQVGGPGSAQQISKVHRKMLDKVDSLHKGQLSALAQAQVPENKSRHKMAQTMYQAWKLFGDPNAVVVFMNQPELFPVCHFEQLQFMQYELEKLGREEGHYLNVIRMSIQEGVGRLHLNEQGDFSLFADGNKKVALVHMAYGYLPEHYPTEKEWKLRIDMERSTAILSPNIRLQLSGTKKIQQVLAKPGVIERFLPDQPERVAALRNTFTGLWGLESDNETIRAVIQDAIAHPRKYVLKAQLGAGKGNFFDEKMVEMLRTMSLEERGAYILQEKIWPIVVKNYMVRPFKQPYSETMVSEVGIYGTLLGSAEDGGKVLWNSVEGFLVRSKAANVNQGGVSEGSGVIDSLLLFPSSKLQEEAKLNGKAS